MKVIRMVINKNGSLTAYVPAEYAKLFADMVQAGEMDLLESEPENFDDVSYPLFEWEHRQ